jgi:hypothetical protein
MLSIATVNVLKSKNILAIAISVALPIVVGGLALAAQGAGLHFHGVSQKVSGRASTNVAGLRSIDG